MFVAFLPDPFAPARRGPWVSEERAHVWPQQAPGQLVPPDPFAPARRGPCAFKGRRGAGGWIRIGPESVQSRIRIGSECGFSALGFWLGVLILKDLGRFVWNRHIVGVAVVPVWPLAA